MKMNLGVLECLQLIFIIILRIMSENDAEKQGGGTEIPQKGLECF